MSKMGNDKTNRYVMDRRETSAVTRARMKDPGYWAGTVAGGLSGGVAGYGAANRSLPKKVRAAMLAGGSAGALVGTAAATASGQRASNKARRKIGYPERDLLGRTKSQKKSVSKLLTDGEYTYLASRVSKMMPVEVEKGLPSALRAAARRGPTTSSNLPPGLGYGMGRIEANRYGRSISRATPLGVSNVDTQHAVDAVRYQRKLARGKNAPKGKLGVASGSKSRMERARRKRMLLQGDQVETARRSNSVLP